MNKNIYIRPISQSIALHTEYPLLDTSVNMKVVNDDGKVVNKQTDMWSNRREQSPIWDNMRDD